MSEWVYDSNKHGLETVFFGYEIEALRLLWSRSGEYLSSREVWQSVGMKMTISRASIINSLNRMANSGILAHKEITGKGGYRSLYSANGDVVWLRRRIMEELTQGINRNLG
jgi:predicted transcriptional regulator